MKNLLQKIQFLSCLGLILLYSSDLIAQIAPTISNDGGVPCPDGVTISTPYTFSETGVTSNPGELTEYVVLNGPGGNIVSVEATLADAEIAANAEASNNGSACIRAITHVQSELDVIANELDGCAFGQLGVAASGNTLASIFSAIQGLGVNASLQTVEEIILYGNGGTVDLGPYIGSPVSINCDLSTFAYDLGNESCITSAVCPGSGCNPAVCNNVVLTVTEFNWFNMANQFTLGTEGTDTNIELTLTLDNNPNGSESGDHFFLVTGDDSGTINPNWQSFIEQTASGQSIMPLEVCFWEDDCGSEDNYNSDDGVFGPCVGNADDPFGDSANEGNPNTCITYNVDITLISGSVSGPNFSFDYTVDCNPLTITAVNTADDVCAGETADVFVNFTNLASSENFSQNYGIDLVYFTTTPTDPYTGGTLLASEPASTFSGGGLNTFTFSGVTFPPVTSSTFMEVYAILNPPPSSGCRPTEMDTITVIPFPIANDPNFVVCEADATTYDLLNQLTVVSPIGTVGWSDGQPSTGGTAVFPPTSVDLTAINDLWATVNDGGCVTEINVNYTISPSPTATDPNIVTDTNLGANYDLTSQNANVNASASTINWYDGQPGLGGGLISPDNNVNLNLVGDLWAEVVDINGCTSIVDVSLTINIACSSVENITTDILGPPFVLYQVSDFITASNTVFAGASADYDAGNYIILQPGFEAIGGCDFTAFINGCTPKNDDEPIIETIETSYLSNVVAYPNPFDERSIVKYTVGKDADVSIMLYDVMGRQQAIYKQSESHSVGDYQLEIDGTKIPAGIYILKIVSGDQSEMIRLKVVR